MDGRLKDGMKNKSPPVFYRTLSPSGPLPKNYKKLTNGDMNEHDFHGNTRVEGRLPKLELGFEYHFFVKINVFEDEWYNFYTHFDHFYPGAHMF